MTPAEIFNQALEIAKEATKDVKDTGYGCGSTLVKIKGNTSFARWAKKEGLTHRDGYWGTLIHPETPFSGTLENEKFLNAFASGLSKFGVHAHAYTHLN